MLSRTLAISLLAGLSLPAPALGGPTCGIFVAPSGTDTPGGGLTTTDPVATIEFAIQRAGEIGIPCIYVQAGTYNESIVIDSRVDLIGGFDTSWVQDAYTEPGHETRIVGGANMTLDEFVTIALISSASVSLNNLVIEGPDAMGTRGTSGLSSYAVYVRDDSDVILQNARIEAGDGAPGEDGDNGENSLLSPAPAGTPGSGGQNSAMCSSSTTILGAPGAVNGTDANTRGGGGGAAGRPDTDCGFPFPNTTPTSSTPGGNATISSGTIGAGGTPGLGPCADGGNGGNGRVINGVGGSGGDDGQQMGVVWFTDSGQDGTLGENGGGGGGGGGSAGCDSGGNFFGATGGSGGAGGFRAPVAGEGGFGGGSSFGVYLALGDALLIDVEIQRGNAGDGGDGGAGATGQPGGAGGNGRQSAMGVFSGKGGNGGSGGHAGAGGGGAGGHSVAIYDDTFSNATLIGVTASGGAAGMGGNGGNGANASLDGDDGTDGFLLEQYIIAGRAQADPAKPASSITPGIINDRLARGLTSCDALPCVTTGDCNADLNNDGAVDSGDLAILLAAWGVCP